MSATKVGEQRPLRYLGVHERIFLVRHNLGYPLLMCGIAKGKEEPGKNSLFELETSIRRRVQLLIDSNTLFSAHVEDTRASYPRWARSMEGISVDQVFEISEKETVPSDGELVESSLQHGRSILQDLSSAPLWRVYLQHDIHGNFRVILLIHHILVDGRGLANTMELLLTTKEIPTIEKAADGLQPLEELPPIQETSLAGHYNVSFLRKRYLDYFYSLPYLMQTRRQDAPENLWPTRDDLLMHPTEAKSERHVINILKEDDFLSRLKEEGRKHDVNTINSVVKIACAIALYSIVPEDTFYKSELPINERREGANHTMYTGNYVSAHFVAGNLSGQLDVWNEIRSFAKLVLSPRSAFNQTFGEIDYIFRMLTATSIFYKPTKDCPTPCEALFHRRMYSERPLRASFFMSNLGVIKNLPSNIDGVYWSSTSQPNVTPIGIDVCGFRSSTNESDNISNEGLSISVFFRRGVLSKEKEDTFVDSLIKILHLLASGVEEGTTYGDILKVISQR